VEIWLRLEPLDRLLNVGRDVLFEGPNDSKLCQGRPLPISFDQSLSQSVFVLVNLFGERDKLFSGMPRSIVAILVENCLASLDLWILPCHELAPPALSDVATIVKLSNNFGPAWCLKVLHVCV